MRRGRADGDSQRNAAAGGDGHDFGSLTPLGLAPCEAPYFAAAKLPSMQPSPGSSFPAWRSRSATTRSAFSNCPLRTHCWNRPCTVWYGGFLLGNSRHCAPALPNLHPPPLPVHAFVLPRRRQRHFFCAVICMKTQAKNIFSYLSAGSSETLPARPRRSPAGPLESIAESSGTASSAHSPSTVDPRCGWPDNRPRCRPSRWAGWV